MIDPELYAIGAALNAKDAADQLLVLSPDEMLTERGSDILTAMKTLSAQGIEANLLTTITQLNGRHEAFLLESMQAAFMPSQQPRYIATLRDAYRRKTLSAAAVEFINRLGDTSEAVDDAVLSLGSKLATGEGDGVTSVQDALFRFIDGMGKKTGKRLTFGIKALDDALGRVFGGKFVVVGARPGTGKSALALMAALQTQGRVLFCSFEMAPEEIIGRAVSTLTGLDAGRIAEKSLEPHEAGALGPCYSDIASRDIWFSTRADTPEKIRAEALRLSKGGEIAAVVVDYLQLMRSGEKTESRRVEVGYISRKLKQLAMELDAPVIALSQLNRQSTLKASKGTSMSELRESGDIEQDADVIVLMYNPESTQMVDTVERNGYSVVRFLIEKNRNGKAGAVVETAFNGRKMRYVKISEALEVEA